MPGRKVTFDMLRRMRELRGKGLTYREIGRRLGVSTATIFLHLGGKERGDQGGGRAQVGTDLIA